MKYESINTVEQLQQFCQEIAECPRIGFDTEFVSEDTFRPLLCLIQVVAGDRLAIIDPLECKDTSAFWDLLTEPGRTVIAHAAREEARFCIRFTGKPIAGLFDTQLAAGFVGMEYPASLGTLVQRLVGKTLPKGETRTNWYRRPLTKDQITYALHDVTDLFEMHDQLAKMAEDLQRADWLEEETAIFQQKVIDAESRENWRRVSGASGLNPRQLETVRQIWLWREERARDLDRLPKRILRDDLLVELARKGSTDVQKIRGIRGMERRGFSDQYEAIAEAIGTALATPDADLPRRPRGTRRVVSPMLSQFLSTSIACISRQHKLAPSIVGNAEDVRELLGYELDRRDKDAEPSLLKGWRGEIVGKTFRRILAGELAIRVADVKESQPLEFIEVDPSKK
ncbi:Ribonuclease D [Rubripirellula lacrimiformis]|uniref:Ribonuclease D n=1 Tax=Rubripirellula lacrimiformis TaxID=1930273 RepID=A0A517N853_9BACT|nr:HRDC domain-containing protein [Rubripirellula lacrimiformis]QDT03300.1 Ribonuclease D [Rubripirellula lacrimiformis]